ncbi:MAG: CoB--CoM heterodisulfide reductase iron-sulfur subunit A family protein [Chloroflexi bacterium]|nr:CoB--CoM heterodisulfide reductase iron-sulfur subunit A family protein [Chloroflexota bacterium]
MPEIRNHYDALVIGGGIAGIQAALDLGEQGFEVLLVDKYPSIGGVMVGLNKVFPTLDCSSCICTPRMAEAAHHDRIQLQTYTEVTSIQKEGAGFAVQLVLKPRYMNEDACIGCGECELACPIDVPHEFDYGLGSRKAIYIPHGNAIPQKGVLIPEECVFCGKCEKVCPAHCIDFTQEARTVTTTVGAVVVATGLTITPMDRKAEYGGGRLANVMSPLQMERIQSSNGPYGRVLRPADGKIPRSIAYVQCAGSRDRSIGVPYCSRVCCMYALKQALLLRHYIHGVDVTLYHMDIRAFGKGYEQFYRRAMAEGVKVVKGKVGRITEVDNYDLVVRVELLDEDGRVVERRHDLVVLAQGLLPAWHPKGVIDVGEADDGFLETPQAKINTSHTTLDGVFVAGVAAGPKDIPDAIVEAGEAAMAAATHLYRLRKRAHATEYALAH